MPTARHVAAKVVNVSDKFGSGTRAVAETTPSATNVESKTVVMKYRRNSSLTSYASLKRRIGPETNRGPRAPNRRAVYALARHRGAVYVVGDRKWWRTAM